MNTSGTSNFINCMDNSVGISAAKILGENGSVMFSSTGLAGPGREIQGAFVAAFSGIVEGASKGAISQLVGNILKSINSNTYISDEERAGYLSDLIALIFQTRNIRGNGKGRRDFAYWMYFDLYSHYPRTMLALLPEFVEHGSWLDLNKMVEICYKDRALNGKRLDPIVEEIVTLYVNQIKVDIVAEKSKLGSFPGDKIDLSLAVKWVPKENRSLDKKTGITKRIARVFHGGPVDNIVGAMRSFRKAYAPVQDAINTTEKLECAKKFDEIKFNCVPGKTMFKKKKAYLYEKKKGGELRGGDPTRLKCRDNLLKHLVDVADGKTTINGKTMYIHELAEYVYTNWGNISDGDKAITNAQFESHVKHFKELPDCEAGGGVVCADVSASMAGDPMAGAVSLAILVSRLQGGVWKNKFISFESNPRWITLVYPETKEEFDRVPTKYSGMGKNSLRSNGHILGIWDETRAGGELTFCESVAMVYTSPWGGTTNYLGVHELLLDICLKNNLTEEDLPKWILTASDMQFNAATRNNMLSQLSHPNIYDLCHDTTYSNPVGGRASYVINEQITSSNSWDDHYTILKESWERAGVRSEGKPWAIPMSIFWNMRPTGSYMAKEDTKGVQMLGGFSTNQLKIFLENGDLDPKVTEKPEVTPWDTFQKAVSSDDYLSVRRVISETGEGIFAYYIAPEPSVDTNTGECGDGENKSDSDSDTSYGSMPKLVPRSGKTNSSDSDSDSDTSYGLMPGLVPFFSEEHTPNIGGDNSTPLPREVTTFPIIENKLKKMKSLLDKGLVDQVDYDNYKKGLLFDI